MWRQYLNGRIIRLLRIIFDSRRLGSENYFKALSIGSETSSVCFGVTGAPIVRELLYWDSAVPPVLQFDNRCVVRLYGNT